MYKHNRGILPNIFNDMFMKHTPSHNYNMRQHNSLQNTTLQNQYQTKHTHLLIQNYGILLLWKIILILVYEYIQKGNETIHLENILTRNTAQLGYNGIIQYNSMYD